jgi:RNA polymerase sigma-70 factor (ECF subfamily)
LRGDEEDFERFVTATREDLGALAYLYTGSTSDAHDLLQETLTRAWQHWDRLSTHPNPAAWSRTVLHHLAVSRWRRRKLERAHLADEAAAAVPAPDVGHIDLVRLLDKLPDGQRRALVLHDVLGLNVAEIAAELRVAEGTVRSRLSRARASLARGLGVQQSASDLGALGGHRHG